MISPALKAERNAHGFSLIIASLLFAASTFFWNEGEYNVPSATLIILSMFFWIHGFTGIFLLFKNKMPYYSIWGLWVAVFGCISGVCFAFLGYLTSIFIFHTRNIYRHCLTIQSPPKYYYLRPAHYFL